jgi:hypothetical protein
VADECARIGNRELAKFLDISLRATCRLIPALRKEGVVFDGYQGFPPRKVNKWFPRAVREYMATRQKERNGKK